jgi:hypothetical protein
LRCGSELRARPWFDRGCRSSGPCTAGGRVLIAAARDKIPHDGRAPWRACAIARPAARRRDQLPQDFKGRGAPCRLGNVIQITAAGDDGHRARRPDTRIQWACKISVPAVTHSCSITYAAPSARGSRARLRSGSCCSSGWRSLRSRSARAACALPVDTQAAQTRQPPLPCGGAGASYRRPAGPVLPVKPPESAARWPPGRARMC